MRKLFIFLGTCLWLFLVWIFHNFLWDWFKQYLDTKLNIKEAVVITAASNLVLPALVVLFLSWAMFQVLKSSYKKISQALPDMPISDVINYMVNDSSVVLKKPDQKYIAEFNPVKGRLVNWPGIGHGDALSRVQTALNNGNLESWGQREIVPGIASFESSLRPIPKSYWESASMNALFCFHETKDQAQAVALPNKTVDHYAGLMLNRKQVMSLWPPHSFWRRLLTDLRFIRRRNFWGKEIDRQYHPIKS